MEPVGVAPFMIHPSFASKLHVTGEISFELQAREGTIFHAFAQANDVACARDSQLGPKPQMKFCVLSRCGLGESEIKADARLPKSISVPRDTKRLRRERWLFF